MLYHQSVLLPDTSCWRQRTDRPERHCTSMIAVKIIRYSTIVLSLLTNCMLIRQFRCPQLSKLLKVRLPFLFFDGPGGGRDFTPMTGRVCVCVMIWWLSRGGWVANAVIVIDEFLIISRLFLPLKRSLTKHSLFSSLFQLRVWKWRAFYLELYGRNRPRNYCCYFIKRCICSMRRSSPKIKIISG